MINPERKNRLRPVFKKEQPGGFYHQLKNRVADTIISQSRRAQVISWCKVVIYPALYLVCYSLLLINGNNKLWFYCCYGCMGLLTTLIVFNIVHDAVHQALFRGKTANARAALSLDILGGNSFVWSKRHVIFHHSFTNIPGWDIDIQQSKIVRFTEKQQYLKAYRYQHFYMPVLYLFYSLNWILLRDFKDFFDHKSVTRQHVKIPLKEYVKLYCFKTFHWIYIAWLPAFILQQSVLAIILGILLMHALMSALTLLVLLPSHLDEDAHFPEADEHLMLEDSWAVHQLKVTNDFGTNNPVLNFVMGGLNHHIAHHLFPNVNHNIITGITAHIRSEAKKQSLPYKCYSLKQVMISHLKLLKKAGQLRHVLEE